MIRGRCESRPRRRSSAGKTERPSGGASFLSDPAVDARLARVALERPARDRCARPAGDAPRRLRRCRRDASSSSSSRPTRGLNLTRIVEPVDVARLHLLDALSALPLLDALAPRPCPGPRLRRRRAGHRAGAGPARHRRGRWSTRSARRPMPCAGFVDALGLRQRDGHRRARRDPRPRSRTTASGTTWSPPVPAPRCPSWSSSRFR